MISFIKSYRVLDVTLDCHLRFDQHISGVARAWNCHIWRDWNIESIILWSFWIQHHSPSTRAEQITCDSATVTTLAVDYTTLPFQNYNINVEGSAKPSTVVPSWPNCWLLATVFFLRSRGNDLLVVWRYKMQTVSMAFWFAASSIGNNLPIDVQSIESYESLRSLRSLRKLTLVSFRRRNS